MSFSGKDLRKVQKMCVKHTTRANYILLLSLYYAIVIIVISAGADIGNSTVFWSCVREDLMQLSLRRWLLTCHRACLPTPAAVSKEFLPIANHMAQQ